MTIQTTHRAIWKFPVLSTGPMEISIPSPGRIVHVGRDPATGLMAFWAEVQTNVAANPRRFEVLGTGHAVPTGAQHRGTLINGEFVWHLFELEPTP